MGADDDDEFVLFILTITPKKRSFISNWTNKKEKNPPSQLEWPQRWTYAPYPN